MANKAGSGQTALVTGASAGIGLDLAACFAKDGYDLIITARTESALRDVADRIAKMHSVKVTPITCDLGAPGGGARLAAEIAQRGLTVDVRVDVGVTRQLKVFHSGRPTIVATRLRNATHNISWRGVVLRRQLSLPA